MALDICFLPLLSPTFGHLSAQGPGHWLEMNTTELWHISEVSLVQGLCAWKWFGNFMRGGCVFEKGISGTQQECLVTQGEYPMNSLKLGRDRIRYEVKEAEYRRFRQDKRTRDKT